MFINTNETVDVTVAQNTITIKAKMDFATRAKVSESLLTLKMQAKQGEGDEAPDTIDATYNQDQYNLALLRHNIVNWDGPAFKGVRCNRSNIERLDPSDELVQKVLAELAERSRQRTVPLEESESELDPKGGDI